MPSPLLNELYTKSGSVGSVCLRLLQCVEASVALQLQAVGLECDTVTHTHVPFLILICIYMASAPCYCSLLK